MNTIIHVLYHWSCLCGLVVRVPGCRSRGVGFDSQHCQIFWLAVSLEQGSLSLVAINEELLQTIFMALSPRANYTDWATATCRRNLVPTFLDKGVSRGERGSSPTVVNLNFLDRNEELLERKNRSSGLENRLTARGVPLCLPCDSPLSTTIGTKIHQAVAGTRYTLIVD
jgi:hypothetical protein